MSNQLPVAVINGIEKFGAKKVASLLGENDIKVMGVGEYSNGLSDLRNFQLRTSLEEVKERAEYWFDFKEDETAWMRAEEEGSRLTVIGVNREIRSEALMEKARVNWRIVNIHGVYGPEMDNEGEETKEIGYLIEAIRLAVANKNLIMPKRNTYLRLLALDDFKEVISRASFLSGTEKGIFNVWGRVIMAEDLAKVLIEEAKMTRFKVEEEEIKIELPTDEEVSENWRKLRWQPVIDLEEGMKETMQYFFSKIDEESRKKKINPIPAGAVIPSEEKETKEIIENKKRFEVMVEENPTSYDKEEKNNIYQVEEVAEAEKEVVEEEKFEEIKPLIVKNSNIRPVAVKEEKPETGELPIDSQDQKVEEKNPPTQKPLTKRGKINWRKYGIWGMAGILAAIILFAAGWGWKNYQMFKKAITVKELVGERKYTEATKLTEKTLLQVKKEEEKINDWGGNKWVWGRRYGMVLKVLEQSLVLGNEAIDLSERAENISEAIFNDKEIDWKKEWAGMKTDLNQGSDELGILQARLSGDWSWVPARWKGSLTGLKQQMSEMSTMITLGNKAIDFLPGILGTDGTKKQFMVLLQNESELRAGGGFIGSWAMLSFENGKLMNFEIKDIYEADGQLKGHVEPPAPIKNYLGQANWFMRDANWQADFPTAAKDIQWFLEKETGRKVDGVIGVNLSVAKAILGVIGEVYVPDFKEKINKDNIYEQAEFYSETNSFAGSTQKASFLGAVGKQLYEEIKNLKTDKRLKLIEATMEMFQKNEIQLALNDKEEAAMVAELGWNGAIYNGKCASGQCFADYLYVVESNLGVNKANYFLYRNIDQTIDITGQSIGRVVKITYENASKNNSWPGGDYKNYIRVYIPASSNLAEVSVNDGETGAKTVISGENLSIIQTKGKKEIGFLVVVPAGKKKIVELRYADQIDLSKQNSFSYLDYVQKQPGYGDTALVTLMTIPNGWEPTQVEPAASLVDEKLLFNQKLDRDIKMGVEIGR